LTRFVAVDDVSEKPYLAVLLRWDLQDWIWVPPFYSGWRSDNVQRLWERFLEAGINYGHRTSRLESKMRPFIYVGSKLIHIIDIREPSAVCFERRIPAEVGLHREA